MIMSVHSTIKSYQNIFLLLPLHNGERKYVTHFVSKLVFFFFLLTWGLVIWLLPWPFCHVLVIELLCLEASAPHLWPMTNERTWVLLRNTLLSSFFLPAWLCLTCAVLSCQMSKYYHLLQGFDFYWWKKFQNQKMKLLPVFFQVLKLSFFTFFLMCLPKILEQQTALFFLFCKGNVSKEIQNILEYMNILGYFIKYANCLCRSDISIQHYL